ncbi:MAG TPA: limonene-1,2-epoxide hydrolase family protein [Mycobacteriales bacterium]|nr:limonene-1,2-epoxide hydrolase family protein [Mycobacteriales bacterium]
MTASVESVFREVLGACSESVDAAQAAVRKHFTEDCVWEQSGFPTTTGPEEAAALLAGMVESIGLARIEVEYRHIASTEDVVLTERLDWLVRSDGSRMGPGVVVGVAEFRDGKISAWREYFDTSGFAQLLDP